ncbi:hypothetical protein [Halioxenophilus aromaticivorans]|uniref:Uncharacterized protein n=1 Tax=Halioxenophilus aromaticivorans TaxID=1306992 RepID=A0AAV3TZG7_9ALTE
MGQAVVAQAQADPIAELDQLLPSQCYQMGTFEQEKSIPGLPTLLRSSGRFRFDCQRGVIWLQQKPVVDGFLFGQDDSYYSINAEGDLAALEARYQAAIGRIMLLLFSANQSDIQRRFDIEQVNAQPLTYELKPKQRRLKRAVQSIFLVQMAGEVGGEEGAEEGSVNTVEMSLVDTAGQTLRVVNRAELISKNSAAQSNQCVAYMGELAATSCARLDAVAP